ncbi:MAG: STAS domain-containing protein [Methylococcales bacterium]|nr:STAS domain-containing protein [Methylococcales bacterium]
MTNPMLRISYQPCKETLSHQFVLVGAVDVHATKALDALYKLPAKATAELNFAQVERINSMGLAQLLKLFDHWQNQGITIRITQANQMVCLLFNKTGLAHLLSADAAKAKQEPSPPTPAPLMATDEPPALRINPQPSPVLMSQRIALAGIIDVRAGQLLEPLYALPANCTVELSFEQVERVNSMGLAQLLKLFEHWQNQAITIRIVHLNRMVSVLFKMTGLTRFMLETPPAQDIPAIDPLPATPAAKSSTLQITPLPSAEALVQRFNFAGIVDVDAVDLLATLYVLPANCAVELNFLKVTRVNSMGLAQLLKLFEHWQQQQISLRITDANRMIGVLFKMTGLTRFLADAPAADNTPLQPQPVVAPTPAKTIDVLPSPVAAVSSDKLKLWVSAQSSQQMNGWYFFNTYLQRHLGREIHLELIHGAIADQDKKIEDMDIVFTKPFEATRLMLSHNFLPLLRPLDQVDEVTLLVRADDPRQHLTQFQGGKIVTAAADNFVYLLGRFLLEQDEAAMANMDYLFSGNDIKSLQMLLKGAADILFVLSDTFNGLSSLTRKNLRQIDQSDTAFAFHLFCLAPQCKDLGTALSNVLLDMSNDSQGRQVLADLGIPGWIKPTPDECDMLAMLYNRYAIGVTAP